MYARLRPNRSPSLLPMRMNAADTNASNATAACTPLAVVSRSRTTAEIDTFINDVSMTNTNIAIESSRPRRGVPDPGDEDTGAVSPTDRRHHLNGAAPRRQRPVSDHQCPGRQEAGKQPAGLAAERGRFRPPGAAGSDDPAPLRLPRSDSAAPHAPPPPARRWRDWADTGTGELRRRSCSAQRLGWTVMTSLPRARPSSR